MSKDLEITDEVKQFIKKIVIENGFKSTVKINYGIGSENGDGFMSKTVTVDAKEKDKSLHLFCKLPIGLSWHGGLPVNEMFSNEAYFYKIIYPAYQEFLKEKNAEAAFQNIPKCYGIENNQIALENLKFKGYSLFDKASTMNDDHIVFTMKTLGKFYAVSYAFQDQKRELYDTFLKNIHGGCLTKCLFYEGTHKLLPVHLRDLLKCLDSEKDKYIIDISGDLEKELVDIVLNVDDYAVEYPILIHGDCWSNNVMYLYNNEAKTTPTDIMLIDWQVIRVGSPAFDIAYFFYPICTKSTIENLDYYLKIYYEEFSRVSRQLGSDPDILYPFSALQKDWKIFAKYSLALSFFNVKNLLMDIDEMPDPEHHLQYLENVLKGGDEAEKYKPRIKKEHLYIETMTAMLKHFFDRDFL